MSPSCGKAFEGRSSVCFKWMNTSMLCASLDGKAFGGEWIHVHVGLSPFAVHLELSQRSLLISHTPILNKKLKVWKKTKKKIMNVHSTFLWRTIKEYAVNINIAKICMTTLNTQGENLERSLNWLMDIRSHNLRYWAMEIHLCKRYPKEMVP